MWILEAHISALRLVGEARFRVRPYVAIAGICVGPLVDRLPFEEEGAVAGRVLKVLPCHGSHVLDDLGRLEQELHGLIDRYVGKGRVAEGGDEVDVRQLVGSNCQLKSRLCADARDIPGTAARRSLGPAS